MLLWVLSSGVSSPPAQWFSQLKPFIQVDDEDEDDSEELPPLEAPTGGAILGREEIDRVFGFSAEALEGLEQEPEAAGKEAEAAPLLLNTEPATLSSPGLTPSISPAEKMLEGEEQQQQQQQQRGQPAEHVEGSLDLRMMDSPGSSSAELASSPRMARAAKKEDAVVYLGGEQAGVVPRDVLHELSHSAPPLSTPSSLAESGTMDMFAWCTLRPVQFDGRGQVAPLRAAAGGRRRTKDDGLFFHPNRGSAGDGAGLSGAAERDHQVSVPGAPGAGAECAGIVGFVDSAVFVILVMLPASLRSARRTSGEGSVFSWKVKKISSRSHPRRTETALKRATSPRMPGFF